MKFVGSIKGFPVFVILIPISLLFLVLNGIPKYSNSSTRLKVIDSTSF